MARILYFASVREGMGKSQEAIPLPESINTVGLVLDFLKQKGDPYQSVLSASHLRVAVNQVYARSEDGIADGDEIAFFPPVSGG